MNYVCHLSLALLLSVSQLSVAAEPAEHSYTPSEQISFAPATMTAFDRSGKFITQRLLAGGTTISEHNGSMGNVTVARVGPDGKVETFCTGDASAARSWMAGELGKQPDTSLAVPVMEK
jgi:hypothetical protein